jgi:hypothetical protein
MLTRCKLLTMATPRCEELDKSRFARHLVLERILGQGDHFPFQIILGLVLRITVVLLHMFFVVLMRGDGVVVYGFLIVTMLIIVVMGWWRGLGLGYVLV